MRCASLSHSYNNGVTHGYIQLESHYFIYTLEKRRVGCKLVSTPTKSVFLFLGVLKRNWFMKLCLRLSGGIACNTSTQKDGARASQAWGQHGLYNKTCFKGKSCRGRLHAYPEYQESGPLNLSLFLYNGQAKRKQSDPTAVTRNGQWVCLGGLQSSADCCSLPPSENIALSIFGHSILSWWYTLQPPLQFFKKKNLVIIWYFCVLIHHD